MNFPAGIESGFEIYLHNSHLRVFIDGKRVNYIDLPLKTRKIFQDEMLTNTRVIKCLSEMGINQNEMEFKFVGCRYGSLNGTSDLLNEVTCPDAPRCENISNCIGYGIVCIIPCNLTRQEFIIARFIALGNQDKEICEMLSIAGTTCHTYKERIREKLHLNNRVEIALWGQRLGIV